MRRRTPLTERRRRQHYARELRVRRAIAAPACERCEGAKDCALHRQRRRTEDDHVAELPRTQGELQRIRHAFTVCVPELREAEEGLDHIQKPFAWSDLHLYAGIAVARIPPVVPYAGLDDGRLAPTKNGGLPVALHGQLTLECGELLDKTGMAVLPITRAQRAPLVRQSRGLPGCPRDARGSWRVPW